jgi:hypothetical protein
VRSGDRLGLRASVASELDPDAREGGQRLDANLCHLLATVENGTVASKPQEFRPQPSTIRLVTGYVSMRCHMLRVDEDTFTMISGLIAIAVVCIAGLLAMG